MGIYAFGSTVQGGIGIFDNSIFLYGNTINYSAAAYSVGIGLDDNSAGDVIGNNVVNNLGRLSTIGAGAVAIALETGASQLTGGNYNNLYCNSTGGGTNLVGKIAAIRLRHAGRLAGRVRPGRAQHHRRIRSMSATPTSTSGRIVVSPVSNAGAPIAGITTDYDGDRAGRRTPDIGADEFTIYTLDHGGRRKRKHPGLRRRRRPTRRARR